MSLHSSSQCLLAAILSQLHCGHLPVKTPSIPPSFWKSLWLSGYSVSKRLCGLVCKSFSSFQIGPFHVSTLDGNIGQKMHWHELLAATSELCSKWTVTDWRCEQPCMFTEVGGGSYFSTDYFVRGRGKCTLFTAAIFCILCLFHVMNMQGGTLHTGQNQKSCYCGVW